ncbi:hypothetical protein PF011_g5989 [Phytophthora fragariae]|uniref:Uncharacterized protein n=1 Tax=Phytophthora fragariae TaxID=53985 RepID=A0A6A3LI66_9STRA|nr:hypothetical protein PF011_g5989 [Phytophthora fragariae]
MLFWRDKLFGSAFSGHPSTFTTSRRGRVSWLNSFIPRYRLFRNLYEDLTAYEGKNRKKWNAFLKLVDIAMETVMLRQLLQNGSPMVLTYGFAGFLAANALSCAINVLTDRFSALTEVFIDSIFDLSAVVLFPIGVLLYCYYDFDFDREVYLTYLEKLPSGSFEHLARSFASPSKIALFRVNFDSLRITSVLDFMLRISMNLTFCYRFERVLEALVINRQLLELPEELRRCGNLRVIYLMYTSTQRIPSWIKELHHLETLQIEGKYGNSNLLDLPEDLFGNFPRLTTIHLGVHENVDHIQPLTGVPNLQSLSLAWLTKLRELPSFQHVPKLGRLILSLMPNMEQLPDMSPLQNLIEFVLLRPNHICCNGFMGLCNLSHISCQSYPLAKVPAGNLPDE